MIEDVLFHASKYFDLSTFSIVYTSLAAKKVSKNGVTYVLDNPPDIEEGSRILITPAENGGVVVAISGNGVYKILTGSDILSVRRGIHDGI